MTEFEQRAQESGVVGHSHDSDDLIGDLDIYEALVNPHDAEEGGAGRRGGAGGPMMMPMGGGAGSSEEAGAAARTAGATSAGAARGTSAASAGPGTSTVGGAPGLGGAAFAGGVPGLGGAGTAAGGLSAASLGTSGVGTGSGSSWSLPTYGTGAAGIVDTPGGTQPSDWAGQVPSAGATPTTGVTLPGSGVSVPGTPSSTGTSIPTGTPVPGPSIPPSGAPSSGGGAGIPSMAGGGAGGGGAGGVDTSGLGARTVTASPEMLHKEAQHWDDTAKEFSSQVAGPIGGLTPSSVDFGMMSAAFPPYSALLERMKTWSAAAGTEFANISTALQAASGGYQDTEETNTTSSTRLSGQVRAE